MKNSFLSKFAPFKSDAILRLKSLTDFSNLGYLPRWLILIIDLAIVTVSFLFTHKLFLEMGLEYMLYSRIVFYFLSYLFLHVLFFWIFRTYSGIIRHSSYIDAIKIFTALLLVLVSCVFYNIIHTYFFDEKIFMNTGLFINTIFSFVGLFIYRILVKQVFEHYIKDKKSDYLIKALIYGSDANAISIAKALELETPGKFRIVGFLDKGNKNASKRIMNLPIVNVNKRIPVIMRAFNATALIMADKSLSKNEKIAIVDDCLEYNCKVYTVPVISDWENEEEISKSIKSFEIHDLLERKPIVLNNNAISNQLFNKVVLISGAAGSIGSEIVKQVISFNPKHIILLDQAETPLHHLSLEVGTYFPKEKVSCVIADVRERDGIRAVFQEFMPDVVFHAAAYKHVPLMEDNPSQAIFVNVQGTKNISDFSYEFNVESFVMVSTDKAVNPSNVMGASKRIAEKYVQALHHKALKNKDCTTRFITTRFGNVLGSNGSVVPLFTSQIAKGGPITITHPDIIRYFMTIPEACQLVLEAGVMGKGGEIFIFDMGKPVKIIDLAYKMIRLAGYTPDKEIKIEIVGLRPGEKLYEELLNDTSKTVATHHEKITIAQEEYEDLELVQNLVKELIKISKDFSKNEIVAKMKEIVPEFKSMNSDFECLDK